VGIEAPQTLCVQREELTKAEPGLAGSGHQSRGQRNARTRCRLVSRWRHAQNKEATIFAGEGL
jgi:hypothetical protein